jgi:hypothetical protein
LIRLCVIRYINAGAPVTLFVDARHDTAAVLDQHIDETNAAVADSLAQPVSAAASASNITLPAEDVSADAASRNPAGQREEIADAVIAEITPARAPEHDSATAAHTTIALPVQHVLAKSSRQYEENAIPIAASSRASFQNSAAAAAPTDALLAQHVSAVAKNRKQKDLDVVQTKDISATTAAVIEIHHVLSDDATSDSAADAAFSERCYHAGRMILNALADAAQDKDKNKAIPVAERAQMKGKKRQPVLSASAAAVTRPNVQTNCGNCYVPLGNGHCTDCYHFKEHPPLLSQKRIRVPKYQVNNLMHFA